MPRFFFHLCQPKLIESSHDSAPWIIRDAAAIFIDMEEEIGGAMWCI